jgi:hypothetical protein
MLRSIEPLFCSKIEYVPVSMLKKPIHGRIRRAKLDRSPDQSNASSADDGCDILYKRKLS